MMEQGGGLWRRSYEERADDCHSDAADDQAQAVFPLARYFGHDVPLLAAARMGYVK